MRQNHILFSRTSWGSQSVVRHVLETEIRFWDLLGERMSFSLETYTRVVTHRRALLFILLCMVAFIASDPSGARSYVPFWFSIAFWPIVFALYVAVCMLAMLIVAMLSQALPNLRLPMPLIGFAALVPCVMLCETSVAFMSNGTFPYDFAGKLFFYFFAVQGIETVFFRFIFPEIRKTLHQNTGDRHLVIGGEKIELTKLLHIEAREHHVHLTFENRKSLARARLGDIVAQTQAEDGMQPHRSWWVARDPAIRAERKNGRLILRLRDNIEVPVARTRVDDVLDWLENHVDAAQ